jgi:predicted anti-sigma-YlaC factor YlaD
MKKMECKICTSNLVLYLEGSLSGKELAMMESHLDASPSCRSFAIYMKDAFSLVGNNRITEPDPFLYTRVMARVERESGETKRIPGLAGILQPAFFSLLLLFSVWAGLKIGKLPATEPVYTAMEQLDPWFNEMGSEPIETFLMN